MRILLGRHTLDNFDGLVPIQEAEAEAEVNVDVLPREEEGALRR
jgi:hypothetical protein